MSPNTGRPSGYEGMIDSEIVAFENPQFMAGASSPLARRYAREAPAIARALESAPGYAPTPCHRLDRLARAVGCRTIVLKDEGERFGLGSFKAAGAVYGMVCQLERMLGEPIDPAKAFRAGYSDRLKGVVFASASSGNHGRSLAWVSRLIGAKCIVYAPAEMSQGRMDAISALGAEVVRTGELYNLAMSRCREDCDRNGWILFSDTSWDDYQEIPTDIMLGYAHIVAELAEQVGTWSDITHVVIQGGVGAFAAGLLTGLSIVDPSERIQAIIVEPREIAALQQSARQGRASRIKIRRMSLMTGISNEEASVAAWNVLAPRARWFVGLSDTCVEPCLRYFAHGGLDGIEVRMGETASAGISAWCSLMSTSWKQTLGLGGQSGALVFSCEGATDAEIWSRIVGNSA